MVRVPTYANYNRLLNQSMKTKSMIDLYSYQATTGIKYSNYAGYGMSASNIVNMEASLSVTQTFLDNNVVLNTSVTAMSTVMESIENSVTSFKSQLNNSLSALSDLKNGDKVSQEVSASISELQMVAFSAMSLLSDALNTTVGGKYIFGAGSSSAPTEFPFQTLDEFQAYYDGININYPTSSNANLSSRDVNWETSGNLTINKDTSADAPENQFVLSSTKGFTSTAVIGGENTTGTLSFSQLDNTLKSTVRGAFNAIDAGDTLIFTDSDGVKQSYIVDKVSEDGKTITFAESTPVTADAEYPDGYNTGSANPVTIGTSFAVGSVVNFAGYGENSNNVAPTMQIVGINQDGSLVVSADESYFDTDNLPITIDANERWSIDSESYYVGGSATETYRISDNQSITLDISANDSVFDKLFRAFGMIAQGNLVKTDENGLITNADEVDSLVNEAMSYLQSAIDNNGKATNGKNETLSLVIAKISANYVTLDNIQKTLESVQGNLEDSVDSVKNVDKTEATVKLLEAQNSLEASYQVLSNVLNLSLLNYMD